MKLKKIVSMMGMMGVLLVTVLSMTGCPTGQEPQRTSTQQKGTSEKPKKLFVIKYDFADCTYSSFDHISDWELKRQTVEEGTEITLAKDGSESTSDKPWKIVHVKHKAGKYIRGWSKNKNGSTKDYDFGQKITATDNMTLYPALSTYGMGDVIDGKTIIYVRQHSTKDKVVTKSLLEDVYTEYSIIGTNWRYIAVDVTAAKNSEKRQWSTLGKNIITENGIGGGKENTEKILATHSSDNHTNNVAKYCKSISSNGYLPSEAEAFLIFKAIRDKKLTGIPSFSQTENIGGGFFAGQVAYFWTSTQSDASKAYVINFVQDAVYGGKHEKEKINAAAFVCPIVYYDDDGKVVQ